MAFLFGCQSSPSTTLVNPNLEKTRNYIPSNTPEFINIQQTASPEKPSATLPIMLQTSTSSQEDVPSPIITLVPQMTPTFDPLIHLKTQCSQEVTSFTNILKPKGFLVLSSLNNLYLYNLDTETNTKIGDEVFGAHISPNQKYMYYRDCLDTDCNDVIAAVQGTISSTSSDEEWAFFRWIDDTHAELNHRTEPYNSILILNPFTEEKETINLNLTNPFYSPGLQFPWFDNAINATLNQIIYFDTESIGRVILWDIPKSKILAWLPYPVPYSPMPVVGFDYFNSWSPDNSQFVINSPISNSIAADDGNPAVEELFTISREGQVSQLTQLGNKYDLTRFYDMRWSPDGRYIAFWLRMSENRNDVIGDLPAYMMIIDTVTNEAENYCISSISPYPLSWSPDGTQVLVQIVDHGLYIFDRSTNLLMQVNVDMNPEGWMVAP
jgi:hypothetical protein